jgi:hypothetical protein
LLADFLCAWHSEKTVFNNSIANINFNKTISEEGDDEEGVREGRRK